MQAETDAQGTRTTVKAEHEEPSEVIDRCGDNEINAEPVLGGLPLVSPPPSFQDRHSARDRSVSFRSDSENNITFASSQYDISIWERALDLEPRRDPAAEAGNATQAPRAFESLPSNSSNQTRRNDEATAAARTKKKQEDVTCASTRQLRRHSREIPSSSAHVDDSDDSEHSAARIIDSAVEKDADIAIAGCVELQNVAVAETGSPGASTAQSSPTGNISVGYRLARLPTNTASSDVSPRQRRANRRRQ